MLSPSDALNKILTHEALSYEEAYALCHSILTGQVSPVQLSALLVALRMKGESVSEVCGAAQAMRDLSAKVDVSSLSYVVDTCGTGGDGAHTFNISTTAAFVAAAAGVRIAKHGGRSVSSSSGSADVLEALGVNLQLNTQQIAECIRSIGLGFMFAPNHHSAMRYAAPVRKELGVRTLFNLLGPLTNPAGADAQVLGVYDKKLVPLLAHVLARMGSRHVMVVHGEDGLDEITLCGKTYVAELKNGAVHEYTLCPSEFGFNQCGAEDLYVADAAQAKAVLLQVLANQAGPARDIVCLNAGAAIYVAGKTSSLAEGIARAQEALSTGAAQQKLQSLIEYTNQAVV